MSSLQESGLNECVCVFLPNLISLLAREDDDDDGGGAVGYDEGEGSPSLSSAQGLCLCCEVGT